MTALQKNAHFLVWDLEAPGLEVETLDRIHCLVLKCRRTGYQEEYVWSDRDKMAEGVRLIMSNPNIAHNQIEYDQWVLAKFFPWFKPHPQSVDTLVMSRMLYPVKGFGHGLDPWGERVGVSKPKIDDWENLTPEEYLHRCREDVEINNLVYDKLMERAGDPERWKRAFRLEHATSASHARQHRRGVLVDVPKVKHNIRRLERVIDGIDKKALPLLPTILQVCEVKNKKEDREENGPYKMPTKGPFLQTGKLTKWYAQHWNGSDHEVSGPHSRIKYRTVDPASRKEVVDFLLEDGWVPEKWNYSKTETDDRGKPKRTSPKLSQQDAFIGVNSLAGKILSRRIQVRHRLSNCQGILDRVRTDGRISSEANPQGTPTARYAHKGLVNIPGAKSYFGREMRSMFRASDGYVILGVDVDSCQLYALANRMGDDEFTAALTRGNKEDGTDAHSLNARILSKAVGHPVSRDDAKTWIYAFLFGGGNAKLGGILGGLADLGIKSREAFLSSFPLLDRLIKRLESQARSLKYIAGLDGRRIYVSSPRKALNYQLQSDEAIFVKVFMAFVEQGIQKQRLDAHRIIQMHDECQYEVVPQHVDTLKWICTESFSSASSLLELKVPMTGTADVGETWYDTH